MYSPEFIKSEILNILKAFDAFCKKNDIRYMLAYGTLIGAVRHKGFIPWDDDVDVIMTADEYMKLRKAAEKDHYIDENKRYRISLPGDKDYAYSFIKVIDTNYEIEEKNLADRFKMGLFIDVFKADNWPESSFKEFVQLKKAHFLLRVNEILVRGNIEKGSRFALADKLLKPVDLFLKLFGVTSEKICRKMENIASRNRPNEYMGNISEGTGWKREKMEKSMYTQYGTVTFEGDSYPAPKDYDRYLSSIYGDYMKLPDPDKRVGHEFVIKNHKG